MPRETVETWWHPAAVDRPWRWMFLGFTFTDRRPNRRRVSIKALKALKQTIRQRTYRTRGVSLLVLPRRARASARGTRVL
jgi:hypothetical protein